MEKNSHSVKKRCALFVVFLTSVVCNGQNRISVGSHLISRNPSISTVDPGGYFVSDLYNRRATYGLTVDVRVAGRFSLRTGIQRIFFASDDNFFIPTNVVHFVSRSGPKTGLQIPVGVNINLVNPQSISRFRVGVSTGFSFHSMGATGIWSSGAGVLQGPGHHLTYRSEASGVTGRFFTLDLGGFVKCRLGKRLWATYEFMLLHSLADEVVVQNVWYTVASQATTDSYTARTVATGSARHHGFGLQYSFGEKL